MKIVFPLLTSLYILNYISELVPFFFLGGVESEKLQLGYVIIIEESVIRVVFLSL